MNNKSNHKFIIYGAMVSLLLFGCSETKERLVKVQIEDADGITVLNNCQEVTYDSNVIFKIEVANNYKLSGCSYENYSLVKGSEYYTLTLENVKYSSTVSLDVDKMDSYFIYYANGGERIDNGNSTEGVNVYYANTHLRINTSQGIDIFSREGYTLKEWNTKPDGSGLSVTLGGRVENNPEQKFYAIWEKWTSIDDFEYELASNGKDLEITKYVGLDTNKIVIPQIKDDKEIIAIDENVFENLNLQSVIIPNGIRNIKGGAFQNCIINTLCFFDNVSSVGTTAFNNTEIKTIHINAVQKPTYATNYWGTFQDKYDRLLSLKEKKKIVLWSGSSTRFGYDSQAIDDYFADYDVVNMGVFAYSVTTPEFALIRDCMKEGDILLHSPEYDAAERQFAYYTKLDAPFWAMMEENYDTVRKLDMRNYTSIFSSFNEYNANRSSLTKLSYDDTPNDYDEDLNPVSSPSYNKYGDYIVYRPNSDSVEPIYGLPVAYTVGAIKPYVPYLKAEYQTFLDKGIKVYYTFSPRNKYALSDESTYEERQRLEKYLRDNLGVPVITDIESSLWEGTYLYGTDNHLSSEGVAIRTRQVINALANELSEEVNNG